MFAIILILLYRGYLLIVMLKHKELLMRLQDSRLNRIQVLIVVTQVMIIQVMIGVVTGTLILMIVVAVIQEMLIGYTRRTIFLVIC